MEKQAVVCSGKVILVLSKKKKEYDQSKKLVLELEIYSAYEAKDKRKILRRNFELVERDCYVETVNIIGHKLRKMQKKIINP